MDEYVQFTDPVGGFDFEHILPPLHATGEVQPRLLTTMTKDLLAKRIAEQVEKNHPMFQGMTNDISGEYTGLMIAKTMDTFLQEYFELKDTNSSLRISECAELISNHLSRFQHTLGFKEGTIEMAALRRTLPSLLQESYEEAKSTIATITAERTNVRKIV